MPQTSRPTLLERRRDSVRTGQSGVSRQRIHPSSFILQPGFESGRARLTSLLALAALLFAISSSLPALTSLRWRDASRQAISSLPKIFSSSTRHSGTNLALRPALPDTDAPGSDDGLAVDDFSLTPSADVTFNSSGNLAAGTYNNVTINSPAVVDLTGNVTINGTLTINNGATLNCGTNVVSGTGTVTLSSGASLQIGSIAGITSSAALGNIQTSTRNFNTDANYVYNGSANQVVGNGLPSTVANLTIANTGSSGNNTVTGNSGQTVTGTLEVQSGIYSSHSDYHDVTIDSGATLDLSGDITVSGIWTNNNGTPGSGLTANGHKVTFNGTTNQTIRGTTPTTFAALQISNTGSTNNNIVSLTAVDGAASQTCSSLSVTSGIFDQGTSANSVDLITNGSGTVASVSSGATWENSGAGDVKLSGDVSNAGTINFNANGTGCGDNDDILIRSVDGSGNLITTQRTWSGTGTFSMTDVNVRDQKVGGSLLNPPILILVNSGTNAGNNTGWTFVDQCTSGTYTWIGGTLGAATDWTVGTNWNPTRATPASGDNLIFDGNSTPSPTVTNVPAQTIATLTLRNNSIAVTLNTSGANTLTIAGATGADLDVPSGTVLTLAGANALTISLTGSGHECTVAGAINFQDGAHQLLGSNAGEITMTGTNAFTTAGTYDASTHPFGTGTDGAVVFQSGATGAFGAGLDPFGGAGHSVVTFDSGSTASFFANSAFSYDGRSYGNLILDGGQAYAGSGANQITIGNDLTIGSGSSLTLSGSAGGDLKLLGNFIDNGSFDPNGRTVKLPGGGTTQTISKSSGTESFFDVLIAETAGGKVQLLSPVTINGQLNLSTADSVLELNGKTLTLNGTVTGSGNFKGDSSATLNMTGTGALGTLNLLNGARTLSSMTMNRTSSGSAIFGNDMSVGSLTLTNGIVNMGSFTLTVSGSVTRSAGYIIGKETRPFAAAGSKAFDVGTANGYSPITVNAASGSFPTNFTVKATQGSLPGITGANKLARYWTLSSSGITADLTFTYLASDVAGTAANYQFVKKNGGVLTVMSPSGTPTTTSASINGISSFSDWTLAESTAVQPGALQFSAANTNFTEQDSGTHNATITVQRVGGSDGAVSVNYQTGGGTATAGSDYTTTSGTLSWPDGDATDRQITIPVIGDTVYEANETVNITLSSPQGGATIGGTNPGTLTIVNDDNPPATLVVNTTADTDDGLCSTDPGGCTLREAINAANFATDSNTINFNIPNTDPNFAGGVYSIQPATSLPTIASGHPAIIDGTSQTAISDSNPDGPEIVLNGSLTTGANGITISASNSTVKGLVVNDFANGIAIGGASVSNSQIVNNYIGTNAAGTAIVAISGSGVSVATCNGCTISSNLISGNGSNGITTCDVFSSTFSNNKIGTDRTGMNNVGNGGEGMHTFCTNFKDNTISGNTFAFNGGDGFRDQPDYGGGPFLTGHINNRITQNSFFSNAGLGINLLPPPNNTIDGVTPNDAGDADGGANNLQNFPVISTAVAGVPNGIIGTLNTTPNSSSGYTIEFFSNTACDSSGNGEGKTYLGSVTTGTTNGSGDVAFTFTGGTFVAGDIITATATDANGNTSEFSHCFTATANTPPVIENPGTLNMNTNETKQFEIFANDPDALQSLSFSVLTGDGGCPDPPGGKFTSFSFAAPQQVSTSPNRWKSVLTIVSMANSQGSYTKKIRASDGTDITTRCLSIVVAPAPSEISVEQPAGTDLTSGASTINFGNSDSSVATPPKTFTIKNAGPGDLTINGITSDTSEFVVDTSGMTTTVTAGNSTTFKVTFKPSAPGARNGGIHIANNDSDENPFDINLSGTGNCPTRFVVNSTGDGSDATPGDGICADSNGKCTLRAAIEEANALTSCGPIDIDFATSGPMLITLSGTQLTIDHNLNINGPTTDSVTVNGNGQSRVFTVNTSRTASISNLTLTSGNGSSGDGGAIQNNGTLTLKGVTLNNNAAINGGAIRSDGALVLINCTISGNRSNGDGGGLYNAINQATLTNVTVAYNRADNDNNSSGTGGGIFRISGNVLLLNTIVADNFKGPSPSTTADNIGGTIDSSSSYNLIGTGAGGLTNGTNHNQVGVATALLGALMNNGGATATNGLLYNSPAIDAGDDTILNSPLFISSDQRGLSRPSNGDLVAGSHVDIGAYERQSTETRDVPNGGNVNIDLNDVRVTFPCVPANNCGGGQANLDGPTRGTRVSPANEHPTISITDVDPATQPAPPNGFVIGNSSNPPLPAFEVTTASVTYDTPVTICFYLPSITNATFFSGLKVFHNESNVLVNRTSSVDFANKLLCAQVNSFSPFVIGHTATPTAANGTVSGQIVDTNGNPVEGAAVRMSGTQNRLTITDAQGNYHFDDVETNGLYVVTPSRANFSFSPSQRSFSQLGNHTEATFTAAANGGGLNPLDTTEYFVRQQYLDFLGREPDEPGFNFWVNNIESCGNDAGCREVKRIDTSAAFFLSIEFQQTGYLVYRTYQAAYADLPGAPVPIRLSEFKPDTQEISNGVVVLQDGWQQRLESNKQAFVAEFVQRSRFTQAYPSTMTPTEFVDKLFANAGVPLTDSDHAAAIAEFGATTDSSSNAARARALRRVAENATLTRQEFNQAFVLMEYFGYLRRDPNSGQDPDFSGYNFWLDKLNLFNGNFQNAELVKAFLSSIEYRGRFPR